MLDPVLGFARAPRRELFVATALTSVASALLLTLGPAPGDAPAHLYRTFLVQHGALVWDNLWYAGNYPLVSYSLFYYLPAALVGNLPLVIAGTVLATVLFASIVFRVWGPAALWPVRLFGVFAAAPLFTGLYSFSLGFATLLGVVRALQGNRVVLAIVLAALTLGFSPLAFAFLCLVLLSVLIARRRLTARSLVLGIALVVIAGAQTAVLLLFPTLGTYPFHTVNLMPLLGVCICGALLARRAVGGAVIATFFVMWGLGSLIAFSVPTPVGDNWSRLGEFVFPLMLLTAVLARFRPRPLAALALAGAFAYNVAPYLLLIPYRTDTRPQVQEFWAQSVSFLRAHSGFNYRADSRPLGGVLGSAQRPRARTWLVPPARRGR